MPGNIDYEQLLTELGSSQFPNLRPAQNNALKRYADFHTATVDLAIELPTGAGKSLIALLIAETWRREGKRVAILTGNKTLARQMGQEANDLGLNPILMEGRGVDIPPRAKREYQRSRGIAIMNYWVYFNQNPVIDPADLLFMDDAHLGEHCLHSLYSVAIERHKHSSLYDSLVNEIVTRFPEYTVLRDALDQNSPHRSPTELMSFLDQAAVSQRLAEIIDASPELSNDSDLKFRWRRMRNHIDEANFYLSTQTLWLRPYVYPLTASDHYSEPEQRIYMSATIGDPADLARRLGTNPISVLEVDHDASTATQGRRLIVMNRIEEEDIPNRLAIAIHAALTVHPKSVWLCSSVAEAEHFKTIVSTWLNSNQLVGHPTWVLSSLGDEIDEFKAAAKGHLFVGGRFDGMDFIASECRLVVLATLPRAINLQEEFFTAYLRDSGFMLRRLNQRIIQALGRCNRSEDDFGVYVLADRRFATHFGRESNRQGIPSNIMAEIDLAENSTELSEEKLSKQVVDFLSGKFREFDAELKECREGVGQEQDVQDMASSATAADEIAGWTALFQSQNYERAAGRFERAADTASENGLRELSGFLRWTEAKARFLSGGQGDTIARQRAIETFKRAVDCGAKSGWFNRLRSSLNRHLAISDLSSGTKIDCPLQIVHAFDELLEIVGPKGHRFERWCTTTSEHLSSESHKSFLIGLQRLGNLLGFTASSPEYGAATDCRWRGIFGNFAEVITFEVKIEHEPSNEITPTAVGQAHNQLSRAISEYNQFGYKVRGTIVTHLNKIDASAESSLSGIRLIRRDAVVAIWTKLMQILSEYRDGWDLEHLATRQAAAERVLTKLPPAGWFTDALDKTKVWIESSDMLEQWPD